MPVKALSDFARQHLIVTATCLHDCLHQLAASNVIRPLAVVDIVAAVAAGDRQCVTTAYTFGFSFAITA